MAEITLKFSDGEPGQVNLDVFGDDEITDLAELTPAQHAASAALACVSALARSTVVTVVDDGAPDIAPSPAAGI